MINITIDPNTKTVPTDKSWQFGMGNDHAALLLRADVCEHLKLIHDELGIKYIRCHGIFDDDMNVFPLLGDNRNFIGLPGSKNCGTVNFHLIGVALDNLLKTGLKPFLELSFMPTPLASGKKIGFPHKRYNNNITMPRDMTKWQDFIRQFISFLLKRYGTSEVESWYFEVWNEPDLACFFKGTQKDYFSLYKATAEAVKSVNKNLRVGGPSTSACRWIGDFVSFCRKSNAPLDFISTHHYPGDGFGNSFGVKDAFKMMSTTKKAAKNDTGLGEIYEKLFFKPDVYKSWHSSILSEFDKKALSEAENIPVYITEWNSMAVFGAPVHDEKYSSAFIIKTINDLDNHMGGYMFWCASDVFEEMALINEPFHGSYGIVNINGIPKPNFWAFKILSQLYDKRLCTGKNSRNDTCYSAFVCENKLQVLVCSQSCDPLKNKSMDYEIVINDEAVNADIQTIDDTHCNPKAEWIKLGSPEYPTKMQSENIRKASELTREKAEFTIDCGKTVIRGRLKTNDIKLYTITLKD